MIYVVPKHTCFLVEKFEFGVGAARLSLPGLRQRFEVQVQIVRACELRFEDVPPAPVASRGVSVTRWKTNDFVDFANMRLVNRLS